MTHVNDMQEGEPLDLSSGEFVKWNAPKTLTVKAVEKKAGKDLEGKPKTDLVVEDEHGAQFTISGGSPIAMKRFIEQVVIGNWYVIAYLGERGKAKTFKVTPRVSNKANGAKKPAPTRAVAPVRERQAPEPEDVSAEDEESPYSA